MSFQRVASSPVAERTFAIVSAMVGSGVFSFALPKRRFIFVCLVCICLSKFFKIKEEKKLKEKKKVVEGQNTGVVRKGSCQQTPTLFSITTILSQMLKTHHS